jgi:hypothetical protein
MRGGIGLLGDGRGLALLATDNEGNLDGSLLAERLDGFLELHALGRALCIVFLVEMSVIGACRIDVFRGNYVRLVVDLGDLEGRKSRNRGLAGERHCRRGGPREGERRAGGGHCGKCYTGKITILKQAERMQFNLRKADRAC